jgi:predicted DNA-binding transcriptional regulator AlpA
MTTDKHYVRLPDVLRLTGLKRSAIYASIQDKGHPFPIPRKHGRASLWNRAEVMDWLDKLPRAELRTPQ